jgi:hypothetical protein
VRNVFQPHTEEFPVCLPVRFYTAAPCGRAPLNCTSRRFCGTDVRLSPLGFRRPRVSSFQSNKCSSTVGRVIDQERWLTRSEVAEHLRVPVGTVADWASKRTGPPYARFGKYARYRWSDLIAWEDKQIQKAS